MQGPHDKSFYRGFLAIFFLWLPASLSHSAPLSSYKLDGEQHDALVCRPSGKTPYAAVVFNHGAVVEQRGYEGAAENGYNLKAICEAFAADGFFVFAPIRKGGSENTPRHKDQIARSIDHVKALPGVDAGRVALVGFSRGGALSLSVALGRSDLKALVLLAPVGREVQELSGRLDSIKAPVLLLVEASDQSGVIANFKQLDQRLRNNRKEVRSITYDRGGAHRLFYDVSYYWDDLRRFLRDKLVTP
jgi:dienelactone hydrolase